MSSSQTITTELRWGGLTGSATSLAIAQAVEQERGFTLVICPNTQTANQLENELRFFLQDTPIFHFPDWETLPYDHFSPHQDIISERLLNLHRLPNVTRGLLIIPISTLMHRLPPTSYVNQHSFVLHGGDKIHIENFRRSLEKNAYYCVNQVMHPGEFAVRGSIIDIFPTGSHVPYRIDLFDDEVDSIRSFDPETQLSSEKQQQIRLLPAKEFPLSDEGIRFFRQNWREQFSGNPQNCPLYQDISQGLSSSGIEYYLPLFFSEMASLFDYIPQQTKIYLIEDIHQQAENFWQEVKERYEQYGHNIQRPLLPPHQLFVATSDIFQSLNLYNKVSIQAELQKEKKHQQNFSIDMLPDIQVTHRSTHPLFLLQQFLENTQNKILFCVESPGRQEALLQLLQKIAIHPAPLVQWNNFITSHERFHIMVSPIANGFSFTEKNFTLITESQLFGHHVIQQRRRKQKTSDTDAVIRNLAELNIGDPVVHIDHGVGRYQGLQMLNIGGQPGEYVTITYSNDDKLYVPVASLHLISRYSGAALENAPLNKLGNEQWTKARRKAAEKARDVAAELLELYARRNSRKGHAYPVDPEQYQLFVDEFPFEETPDQQQAIEATLTDMASENPMDRLICGDVGFGKTEVAMRAAFVAVTNNKQVALLVPTTLLAQQHYENFRDRFSQLPVQIEVLSRFRTGKEQSAIIKKLETGQCDILIGTHKLLSEKIKFSELGLLIIDEEHRFGVRQKEKLKSLRAQVDILTLTATPIPRTLNMAMSGLRELSIIATPPQKRLAVKTFVMERHDDIIREAILRENLRGGQVYFVHNKVETIERVAEELKRVVPEARIAVAHGQMRERQLEQIMSDFYHLKYNVLLCSTIIETGIDVPTANTIIIDRADHFGLAQLHQLRGRVGRSHHQAYAYLLSPGKNLITADATKRLKAIAELDELGIGFTLATHDLEIRGAGELLGEEQSGNINTVGFNLYMELLDRAITSMKTGEEFNVDAPLQEATEVDLHCPTLIPESYVADVHTRLILYKRIASAHDDAELDELMVELIDRFGLVPQPVKTLFTVTRFKLTAQKLGIKKIDANSGGARFDFQNKTQIDPMKIIKLIQQPDRHYRLEGPERLRLHLGLPTEEVRIHKVEQLLAYLQ